MKKEELIVSEENGICQIELNRFIVNSTLLGPTIWNGLRENTRNGFHCATFPETIEILYGLYENKENERVYKLLELLKDKIFCGNTAVLHTAKGMYVQDEPIIDSNKDVLFADLEERDLEKRLETEENGVLYSKDKKIRKVPYNFKTGYLFPKDFSKNSGLIAIVGSEENAEKTIKLLEFSKSKEWSKVHFRVYGATLLYSDGTEEPCPSLFEENMKRIPDMRGGVMSVVKSGIEDWLHGGIRYTFSIKRREK